MDLRKIAPDALYHTHPDTTPRTLMREEPRIERAVTNGAELRPQGRFPISPVGWVGIAAAVLGVAYFLVPVGDAERASEPKLVPESKREAPRAAVNRDEVSAPTAAGKSANERDKPVEKDEAPR